MLLCYHLRCHLRLHASQFHHGFFIFRIVKHQSLLRAHGRYVQLATIRENGRPANRTVVFRGFLWNTDKLTFVTDARSCKVKEVASNPFAEVAWYFPDSREQFRYESLLTTSVSPTYTWRPIGRIQGTLSIVQAEHEDEKLAKARVTAWKNMSDGGRTQFLWPEPGLPRPEVEDKDPYDLPAPSEDDPVSENFSLVVLDPTEVDYLSLKGNKRKRFCKSETEGGVSWSDEEINP